MAKLGTYEGAIDAVLVVLNYPREGIGKQTLKAMGYTGESADRLIALKQEHSVEAELRGALAKADVELHAGVSPTTDITRTSQLLDAIWAAEVQPDEPSAGLGVVDDDSVVLEVGGESFASADEIERLNQVLSHEDLNSEGVVSVLVTLGLTEASAQNAIQAYDSAKREGRVPLQVGDSITLEYSFGVDSSTFCEKSSDDIEGVIVEIREREQLAAPTRALHRVPPPPLPQTNPEIDGQPVPQPVDWLSMAFEEGEEQVSSRVGVGVSDPHERPQASQVGEAGIPSGPAPRHGYKISELQTDTGVDALEEIKKIKRASGGDQDVEKEYLTKIGVKPENAEHIAQMDESQLSADTMIIVERAGDPLLTTRHVQEEINAKLAAQRGASQRPDIPQDTVQQKQTGDNAPTRESTITFGGGYDQMSTVSVASSVSINSQDNSQEAKARQSQQTVLDIVNAGAGSIRAQSKETRAKTYAADVADMGEQFSNMKERESAARKRMEELHKAQREEDAKNSKDGMKYGMAGAGAIFALMEGAASLAMVGPILGPVLIAVAVVGLLKFGYEATKVASSKLEQYQDKQELKDHFKQEKASLKDLSDALTSSRNADDEVVDKTMSDGVMSKVAQQEGVAPGAEDIGEVVGARLAQTTGIPRSAQHNAARDVSELLPAAAGDARRFGKSASVSTDLRQDTPGKRAELESGRGNG